MTDVQTSCHGIVHAIHTRRAVETSDSSKHLLFEVSTILLVDKYKIQVVADGELLVDVSHRRRQVVAVEKQTYWYRFT